MRGRTVISGYRIVNSNPNDRAVYSYREFEEVMNDYTGKKKVEPYGLLPPSDMDHSRVWKTPPTMSYRGSTWSFFGIPLFMANPGTTGYAHRGTSQRSLENADLALKFLADTHPFRSEFSVPTAIAELLDMGQLFKMAAKSYAGLLGGGYLNYRFGIVQFHKDIQTLSTITTSIESRIKEFDSMNLFGGLRRAPKKPLYSTSGSAQSISTLHSEFGTFVDATKSTNWTYRITGSVRWRWKGGIYVSLSKLEAFNEAVKAVLDLGELDASTIWNSIPWTWLVDYFADIGSYLQAHENDGIVEPFDLCIMRAYRGKEAYVPRPTGYVGMTLSAGSTWTEINSRDVITSVPLLPPIRLGLLSKSQALVITSLIAKFYKH